LPLSAAQPCELVFVGHFGIAKGVVDGLFNQLLQI